MLPTYRVSGEVVDSEASSSLTRFLYNAVNAGNISFSVDCLRIKHWYTALNAEIFHSVRISYVAPHPLWVHLHFTLVPGFELDSLSYKLMLAIIDQPLRIQRKVRD